MSIEFECPNCGQRLKAESPGITSCPHCSQVVDVASPPPEPAKKSFFNKTKPAEKPRSSPLTGALMVIAGVAWVAVGLFSDTAPNGTHNVGLMNDREVNVIVGGVVFIGGILVGIARRIEDLKP